MWSVGAHTWWWTHTMCLPVSFRWKWDYGSCISSCQFDVTECTLWILWNCIRQRDYGEIWTEVTALKSEKSFKRCSTASQRSGALNDKHKKCWNIRYMLCVCSDIEICSIYIKIVILEILPMTQRGLNIIVYTRSKYFEGVTITRTIGLDAGSCNLR